MASPWGLGFLTTRWTHHSQTLTWWLRAPEVNAQLHTVRFGGHTISLHWLQASHRLPRFKGVGHTPPHLDKKNVKANCSKAQRWEIPLIFGKHSGTHHSLAFLPTLSQPQSNYADSLGQASPVPSSFPHFCGEGPHRPTSGPDHMARGGPCLSHCGWAKEARSGLSGVQRASLFYGGSLAACTHLPPSESTAIHMALGLVFLGCQPTALA